MNERILIPTFPLSILPLPGEFVPLHIFEPRYRQLIQDAEDQDVSFGIYFNSEINESRVGSLMKLESVIKRYPAGEMDVITRCVDVFTMKTLYRTFKNKLYPGGDVGFWRLDMMQLPGAALEEIFVEYLNRRNIHNLLSTANVFQMALELNLDVSERYRFLLSSPLKKEQLLVNKLRLNIHVLEHELKSREIFHLN